MCLSAPLAPPLLLRRWRQGGRERRGPLLAPAGDCGAAAVPLLGQVMLSSGSSVGTRRRCWRSKQGGFYRNIREDPLPVWGRGHGGCTGWGGLAAAGQELSHAALLPDNTLPPPPAEQPLSTNMLSIILQYNISYNQTIRH